jgi:hypothetical protein
MKVIKHKDKWYLQSDTGYKEILLSTDTELQKDGVQSIDDEFLKWFVKNPSCEWVEVGYGWIRLAETDNEGYWVSIPDKQFEMQQEEPKQETTLEEVAKWSLEKAKEFALERFKSDRKKGIVTWDSILEVLKVGVKTGHKFGAKWQAERMYSEEDMRGMYDKSCGLIGLSLLNDQTENDSRFKKLFEQFKKK